MIITQITLTSSNQEFKFSFAVNVDANTVRPTWGVFDRTGNAVPMTPELNEECEACLFDVASTLFHKFRDRFPS